MRALGFRSSTLPVRGSGRRWRAVSALRVGGQEEERAASGESGLGAFFLAGVTVVIIVRIQGRK